MCGYVMSQRMHKPHAHEHNSCLSVEVGGLEGLGAFDLAAGPHV